MSTIRWRGETYVSLKEVAVCFGITLPELDDWIDQRFIDAPAMIDGVRAFPVQEIDRIALIVHYTHTVGFDEVAVRLFIQQRYRHS